MTVQHIETSDDGYVQLVTQIVSLLRDHPSGAQLALLFKPEDLALRPDEVLVQRVPSDGRSITLEPVNIADLEPVDVMHQSQQIGINDDDIARGMARCLIIYPDGKNARHIHN